MRKLLLLILTLFIANLAAMAGRVSEAEALQKAQQFMQGKNFVQKQLRRAPSLDASKNAYYVFNAENSGGFVIVAGDDRMPDILGYSEKGSLNVDSIPDGLKWLLGYYEEIAKHIGESGETTARTNRAERTAVSPLMVTEWGQDYPYNLKCPYIDETQCITGCVATAMAQIMNYCQWPEGETTSIKGFTSYSNKINLPELEPTTFNWNYMNVSEISKLMRYCGQAIEMDYGLNTSGTFSENAAYTLVQNFGYDSNIKIVYQQDYNDEEWETLMYQELDAKRAVLFSGTGASGDVGHAFVIHGYDAGRFYINWGWEGLDDGYFTLTGLTPDGGDYSYYQSAVIGIQPPGGVRNQPEHPIVSVTQLWSPVDVLYNWRDENGYFNDFEVSTCVKSSCTDQPVLLALGLYNENGLQKVLCSESHTFTDNEEYDYWVTLSMDNSIADGDYYIYPISRRSDAEEWLQDTRADVNCLKVSIHDNLRKIQLFKKHVKVFDPNNRLRNYVAIYNNDGVYYDLYVEAGKNRAIVLPAQNGYKGDIFIPDYVTYEGVDYAIYEASNMAFSDCPELTSLSTSMYNAPSISNCDNLTKLEFREGVVQCEGNLLSCYALKEMVYPESVQRVQLFILYCNSLKSVYFKNPEILNLRNIYVEGTGLTDIYFYQSNPPGIEEATHMGADIGYLSGTAIHIPKGTMNSYKSSIWGQFQLVDDVSVDYDTKRIYWGYCQSTNTPGGRSLEIEDQRGFDREFAIRVPAKLMNAYKGCKITGIQFYALHLDMDLANYVFVTKPGVDYLSKQSTEPERNSWVTTQLSNPVTIDGDELFVGIGRRDNLRISYSTDNFEVDKDILCARTMNPNNKYWNDTKPIGEWESVEQTDPVCLRFIIEGENLPNDIHLNGVNVEGKKLYATLFSRTPDYVDSFTLNWELENGEKRSQVITDGLVPNGQGEYAIDLPANLKGFNHDIQFEIADINGKPDAIPENSNKAYSIELQPETTYPRMAVMESLTGTWCGFSPRGIVAMQLLKQKYGERYIPIAVHYANEECGVFDIMNLPAYECPVLASTSVPMCTINRGKWCDPYTGTSGVPYQGIIDDMNAIMEQKAPAALGVETRWLGADKTSIEITTSTVIGGDDDHLPYQLGYVILENGLHGDGEEWNQSNGFHNYADGVSYDPNLMPYVDMPEQLTNMKYNHVPVAAWGTLKGLEGTVPESVIGEEIYGHTFNANIAGNTHIQNKDSLSVVVLLLNKNTGAIINATQCKVGESSEIPTPIKKVTITANSYTRAYGDVYNLQGNKVRSGVTTLEGLAKGIYIVNGRKIVVK